MSVSTDIASTAAAETAEHVVIRARWDAYVTISDALDEQRSNG